MSARTDLVRRSLEGEPSVERIRENYTDDAVLHAPGIGAQVQGLEAIAVLLERFFETARPRYRLVGEPVEQGDFVMAVCDSTIGDHTFALCNLYRFRGDKISGLWAIRA